MGSVFGSSGIEYVICVLSEEVCADLFGICWTYGGQLICKRKSRAHVIDVSVIDQTAALSLFNAESEHIPDQISGIYALELEVMNCKYRADAAVQV